MKKFNAFVYDIEQKINNLQRLENVAVNGLDIQQVQIAETVLRICGNLYGQTDDGGRVIAEYAIEDIANNCDHLKKQFFGNKTYYRYYQGCDCEYGMGPRHGGVVDKIGLRTEARVRDLTDTEKDVCIYYIKNHAKIKEAKKEVE